MAIEPFRQRVGIPNVGNLLNPSIPQVNNAGSVIMDIGQQVMKLAEPGLKERAIKQATSDFAAVGLGKDADGNYTLPDTPEGAGVVYAKVFDEAAKSQYAMSVFNDTELKLNRIQSENIDKTPAEVLGIMSGTVEGVLQNADPSVRGVLYEQLMREVRQRDLQNSNEFRRKSLQTMVEGFDITIKSNTAKAASAWGIGTPEANAEAELNWQTAREAVIRKISINALAPEALKQFDESFISVKGSGQLLSQVRDGQASGELGADEVADLIGLLDGNAKTGTNVLGYDQNSIFEKIPGESERNSLRSSLLSVYSRLKEEDRVAASEDAMSVNIDAIERVGGQPFGMSPQDFADAQVTWAARNNVDLTTQEGLIQLHTFSPNISKNIYERVFQSISSQSADKVEQLRPLFEKMRSMPDRNGQTVDISSELLSNDQIAFMSNYSAAMQFGGNKAQAVEQARAIVSSAVSLNTPNERSSFLREAIATATNEKNTDANYKDYLSEVLDIPSKSLNPSALRDIELDAAQLTSMGMSVNDAFGVVKRRFKQNYTQDETSLTYQNGQRAGYDGAYIRRNEAVPTVTNIYDPKGEGTREWVKPYVNLALDKMLGSQIVPGLPDRSKLKFGENVFLHYSKQAGSKEGAGYQLYYFDKNAGGPQVPLMGKDGSFLTIYLGEAAKKQQNFASSWLREKALSQSRGNKLWAESQTVVPGIEVPVVNAAKLKEYNAWKAEHNKKYPSGPVTKTSGVGAFQAGSGPGAIAPAKIEKVSVFAPPSLEDIDAPSLTKQMRKNVTQINSGKAGRPLTERLNNPGALRWDGKSQWRGMVGKPNPGDFVQFATPQAGRRAGIVNLQTQGKQGVTTLSELMKSYAPASDNNDPVKYAKIIADNIGVSPNAKINLTDFNVASRIFDVITNVEGGY